MVKGLNFALCVGCIGAAVFVSASTHAAPAVAPLAATGAGNVSLFGLAAFVSESASFFVTAPTGAGTTCQSMTAGTCTFSSCDLSASPGAPTLPAQASAGTITLSGGMLAAADALTSADGTTYAPKLHFGKGWSDAAGSTDMITVTAAGGTGASAVPAFTASLAAVQDVGLTNPTCAAASCSFAYAGGAPGALSTTQDLTATWTNMAAPGNVSVSLSTSSTTSAKSISCTFPASAGTGTVPASLVAMLDAPGAGITASASVMVTNSTAVTAGTYAVNVSISEQAGSGAFTE